MGIKILKAKAKRGSPNMDSIQTNGLEIGRLKATK